MAMNGVNAIAVRTASSIRPLLELISSMYSVMNINRGLERRDENGLLPYEQFISIDIFIFATRLCILRTICYIQCTTIRDFFILMTGFNFHRFAKYIHISYHEHLSKYIYNVCEKLKNTNAFMCILWLFSMFK